MVKITQTEQGFRLAVMPLNERDYALWELFKMFPEIKSITIDLDLPRSKI